MEVSEEQSLNAECPILVTLLGIVTEVSEEQPLNAEYPISVTKSGMITEFSVP